jgi:hypothetical protein
MIEDTRHDCVHVAGQYAGDIRDRFALSEADFSR